MLLCKFAYIFRQVIVHLEGENSNILRVLQLLLFVMGWIFLVYDGDIQISSFTAFPRIAMSQHLWNFEKPLSLIPCFFLQLSWSIFFKIGIFNQSRRKLKTKLADRWSKIGNHNKIQWFVFAFEDRKHLNTINVEGSLDSTRPIGWFIVLNNFIADREWNLLDP